MWRVWNPMIQKVMPPALLARGVLVATLVLAIALGGCRAAAGMPDDDLAVKTNPCSADDAQVIELQVRSPELAQAQSSELVTWTEAPEIDPGAGTLAAAGILEQGATLFDPLPGDSPAAFSVHYAGHQDSLVELISDRPAGECWQIPATVTPAPLDLTRADDSFALTASSPLFRGVDGGELELRAWGIDADGQPALLAATRVR